MNNNLPPAPKDYFLGFNLGIDRQSILNLLMLANHCVGLNAKSVTVCIASFGGAPDQALYAYEVLRALPVPVHTHGVGTVQSAALTLLMAGENRFASPGTNFLFHETVFNVGAPTPFRYDDLLGQAQGIEHNDMWSHKLMAARLKKPVEEVAAWFKGQNIRDTDFAQKNGVIQEIQSLVIPPQAEFAQVQYKF